MFPLCFGTKHLYFVSHKLCAASTPNGIKLKYTVSSRESECVCMRANKCQAPGEMFGYFCFAHIITMRHVVRKKRRRNFEKSDFWEKWMEPRIAMWTVLSSFVLFNFKLSLLFPDICKRLFLFHFFRMWSTKVHSWWNNINFINMVHMLRIKHRQL